MRNILRRLFGFPVYVCVSCGDCDYLNEKTFWYLSTQEWSDTAEARFQGMDREFNDHECGEGVRG